jgi:O-antigen/teichoic acid export membrane protein
MLKKFVGQSSIYMVGSAVGMMSSFISFPILTRIFSTSEYGIFSLVSFTMYLGLAIAKFGMQHSAVRFYDEFRLNKRGMGLPVYYSTLFWGPFGIALIVALLLMMCSPIFSKFIFKTGYSLFWIMGGLIITEALFIRIMNFLRIEQRPKPFVLVGLLQGYGQIGFGIFFVIFVSKTVEGFLMGNLLLNLTMLLVVIPLYLGKENLRLGHFSFSFIKENIMYGYPLIGFELSSVMMKLADRYIIQILMGASAVGIYSAAGNLTMGIANGIFSSAWLAVSPIFMRIWSEQGDKRTQEFLNRVIKFLTLISIPIIFGLAAISEGLLTVFATTKFSEGAATIPFLIGGTVLWGFCPFFGAGLLIHKETKLLNRIVLVGTAFNIALTLVMVPKWGIMGAAVATFVTFVMVIIFTIRVSFRYLKIDIDLFSTGHSIVASLCMYMLVDAVPIKNSLIGLILKIAVGIICYCLLLNLLNKEVREVGGRILRFLLKSLTPGRTGGAYKGR